MCRIIAIANQKGGVGKTTTTVNLGIGLSRVGNKVLIIDMDSQGDLTICLGHNHPDEMELTIASTFGKVIKEEPCNFKEAILHHKEGIDYIPCNIELSGIEITLANVMRREYILKQILNMVKDEYDYILIDCSPSLSMLTINAFVAADGIIIPVQAEYLSAKGLEQLARTIKKVKNNHLNPDLEIEGILFTMVDSRTIMGKEVISLIQDGYGEKVKIFDARIPRSIKASEASAMGSSIFAYDPEGKIACEYQALVSEVLHEECFL